MRLSLLAFSSTAIVCSFLASSVGAETYTIGNSFPFAEGSGASSKVKSSCKLETKLPNFIRSAAKNGVTVQITTEPLENVEGKILYIEFTHILGTGGGAWSGPKTVTVHGELRENGEIIGTFTATRYSTGGAFGGFKGTCSILGRCVKTLGSDIALWLQNPTMDAMLGNS
jgi:hypothetical protein